MLAELRDIIDRYNELAVANELFLDKYCSRALATMADGTTKEQRQEQEEETPRTPSGTQNARDSRERPAPLFLGLRAQIAKLIVGIRTGHYQLIGQPPQQ